MAEQSDELTEAVERLFDALEDLRVVRERESENQPDVDDLLRQAREKGGSGLKFHPPDAPQLRMASNHIEEAQNIIQNQIEELE